MTDDRPGQARLAQILLAAADTIRTAGRPDDPIGMEQLARGVVDGVLKAGDSRSEVADAQADACYALLAAQFGRSPLAWAGTRAQASAALTTAARTADTA